MDPSVKIWLKRLSTKTFTRFYSQQNVHRKTLICLSICWGFSFLLLDVRLSKFFMFLRISKSSEFMVGFSSIVTMFFLMAMISLFIYKNYHNKLKIIASIWLCLISAMGVLFIIKQLVFRTRPYISLNITHVGYHYNSSSFPGGAGIFFATVPFLWKLWGKDSLFIITPFIIHAISSVYIGENYLSDVIAGIAISYFIGYKLFNYMGKA